MKATTEESNYLEGRGWQYVDAPYNPYWCWRQPKTGALFQLEDALDTQRGLENESAVKMRNKKGIKGS